MYVDNDKIKDNNDLEFDQPLEEVEVIDVPSANRSVYTEQGDPEVESLYGKYKRGKLIVQPDFQRYFVWDTEKSSRLMESVLLDIPLPVIYLSEEKDSREYVIDGQQRLTAFFSFVDGKFPNGKEFKCRKCHKLKYTLTAINKKSQHGKILYQMNRMDKLSKQREKMGTILYKGEFTKRFKNFLKQCARAGYTKAIADAMRLMEALKNFQTVKI